MEQKTAQQKAEERFQVVAPKPSPSTALTDAHLLALAQEAQRSGFATCHIELVEPRDRIIQELVDKSRHGRNCQFGIEEELILCGHLNETTDPKPCTCGLSALLAKAKEQFGIEPSELK